MKLNIKNCLMNESCSRVQIQFFLFYLFQVVLPDTEFIINLGDWPLVLKTKNAEEQVKVFFLEFIFSPNYVHFKRIMLHKQNVMDSMFVCIEKWCTFLNCFLSIWIECETIAVFGTYKLICSFQWNIKEV